jgi:geranylgeranyl transferase type-2 subunit alpha
MLLLSIRRKACLTVFIMARSLEDVVSSLQQDLRLTTMYLKQYPKVYWIWTHRKWCLEQMPLGPDDSDIWRRQTWAAELALVEKMLDRDPRNCK